MYSGSLKKIPFQPDEGAFRHAREREEQIRLLRAKTQKAWRDKEQKPENKENLLPPAPTGPERPARPERPAHPESLARLLEQLSPEDSALIALIVFLLCDNSENDVVLLGILLYVLLSK